MNAREMDSLVESIKSQIRAAVSNPADLPEDDIESAIYNALWLAGEPVESEESREIKVFNNGRTLWMGGYFVNP